MKYLVALAIALAVLVGMPADATNAAPESQYVIPAYTDWAAPLYQSYYTPVYYVRPYYHAHYRSYYNLVNTPYNVYCRYC